MRRKRRHVKLLMMLIIATSGMICTTCMAYILGSVEATDRYNLHLPPPSACYWHFVLGIVMGFLIVGGEAYLAAYYVGIRRLVKISTITNLALAITTIAVLAFTKNFLIILAYFGMQTAFILPFYFQNIKKQAP